MHYTLKDDKGTVLDQSTSGEPLLYLHGHQNIIPGLEKELANLKVGDRKRVHVKPEDGYGSHDPEKCFAIPRKHLPPGELKPGMVLELSPEDGPAFLARITDVGPADVQLDANHPMAGKDLYFDIEIVAIRPATQDEISHGHAHGPGGHHHHH